MLAKNETLWSALLNRTTAEMVLIDRDGTIVAANEAWRRFASDNFEKPGNPPNAFVGTNYLAACNNHSDNDPTAKNASEGIRAVLSGKLPSFSMVYPCDSLETRLWFSMQVTPLGQGAVIEHFDITDHTQADRSTHDSESRFSAIFNGADSGILVADVDTKIFVDANPAMLSMLGYSREELLGKSIADIHPKDSLLKVSKAFDYLADSERKLTPDIPVLRKGGAMFFADITASRLVINGRNCLAGFFTDVTDRVAMQAELHRYRNQLEEFVEARAQELHLTNQSLRTTVYAMDRVGIAVHWTDADTGQFLYANKFAAEMLGYTERELLALNVAEIDPTFRNHYFKAATETFRQKSCVQFESNNLTKDKRVVPVEVTLHFLAGNYSEPNRFIAFVRDITERKHIEGTVLRALEDAENANRAKSAFLANMSHEVRTPLNAIAGMAYLIRQSGLTAEQSDRFRKLEAASEHLLNIINSVLDIAKIEAGKFTLVQSSVQLKTIMRNVSSMLRDGAQAKHLNFTIQLDTFPDDLLGDSTRLQQCLLNYASNSIKFSEHGTVAMRAQLVRETDDAVLVRFEVEDDGIGIAADVLERLFNSFEQADISITRK